MIALNEPCRPFARFAPEFVPMGIENDFDAAVNRWHQVTPKVITPINYAGQKRYRGETDDLCDEAPSRP